MLQHLYPDQMLCDYAQLGIGLLNLTSDIHLNTLSLGSCPRPSVEWKRIPDQELAVSAGYNFILQRGMGIRSSTLTLPPFISHRRALVLLV